MRRDLLAIVSALGLACTGSITSSPDAEDAGPEPPLDLPDAGPVVEMPAFCQDYPPADLAGASQSSRVEYAADGFLTYVEDADGNVLPDFGYAGYHFGEREPPEVAEVERLGPASGDATGRIQAALDRAADLAPDANGHRGAVVLDPGRYPIAGTLRVRNSGVVLRGSGSGGDASVDTILEATGNDPNQRPVIVLGTGGSGSWSTPLPGTEMQITTSLVRVGSRSFEVDDPTRVSVGDRVLVRHPSTAAWIAALDGGGAQVSWVPGQLDIRYLRRVVAKDGSTVTLDVPVYNHLDRSLSQSVMSVVDDSALVREAGVERLRIDIQTAGGQDESHAWNGVDVAGAEDSWVRDVTALHFTYAGVRVRESNRITVRGVRALDPVGQATGGRFYNLDVDAFAQQVLFVDCEASYARHAFVANGASSVSGIVFLRSTSRNARTSSEGHRRWSQALLFDNIVEVSPGTGRVVGLYNRGDWGTQHGWASAHSVLWRYDTGGRSAVVQKPPTAQNWAIGTIGNVTGNGPFPGPPGHFEPISGTLAPASLYEAQLCDRLRRRAAGRD
jgi:hypothetical protein